MIRTRTTRGRSRGFTLIELMTVVIIVGILATLALVSYRKFIRSAKTSEAINMVGGSIRGAEESYRAETMRYLETSPGFTRFYPSDTLGKMKWAWDNDGHTDYPLWRQLGARPDGPVYYGYKVAAGLAGGTPPTIDCVTKPTWAATTEPWYVIEAKGDLDGDPKFFSCVAASSFTGEVYVENEGE